MSPPPDANRAAATASAGIAIGSGVRSVPTKDRVFARIDEDDEDFPQPEPAARVGGSRSNVSQTVQHDVSVLARKNC